MKNFTQLCLGLACFCLIGTTQLYAQEKAIQEIKEIKERAVIKRMSDNSVRADRPLIGIYTGHSQNGVVVSSTVEGGGAAAAGLEAGDVITAINGNDIRTIHDLEVELSKHQGGAQVAVNYQRYGQSRQANVTLKARPNIRPDRPLIGIYPGSNDGKGIKVDDITASGGAVSAGIKSGDVITKINKASINSLTDLKAELSKYQAGDQVAVEFLRDGQVQQTQVGLRERGQSHNDRDRDPCAVFIGVSLSGSGEDGRGVHVSGIIDETPAKTFGVQSGDDILALDDVYVNTFNELLYERNKHQPDDYFTLTVLREGRVINIDAQFNSCEQEKAASEAPVEITEVLQEEIQAPQDIIIDNSLKVEQWKAYPNPAFGTLNVEFQTEALPTTVSIIDATGRSVYRETMNQFDGYYNQQIDLSDITPGNYYLQIRQGDQFVTEKIVIIPRA